MDTSLRIFSDRSGYTLINVGDGMGTFVHQSNVVEQFHKLFYYSARFGGSWTQMAWLGAPILKCPMDMWIYQELIWELKPDVIVETGTYCGGTTVFLANICDLIKKGRVISVDVEDRPGKPAHERITYLLGSSTSDAIVARIRSLIGPEEKVLVILDSDHHEPHVLSEMRLYEQFVKPGGYLVVEDSNVNSHPVYPEFGPGPMEAIAKFLAENRNFQIDAAREKFFMTFNPNGYLKRIS